MASNKEAVGISISLPLYFNGYTEYERAQLNFLKSTVVLRESKDEEQKFFFKSLKNMATIDQKKHIANDDKNRYKSLLTRVEALYNNGLESEHTLLRLQNSYKIRELDLIDLELDKTMIMIDVYAKVEEF
jgi:outer membrane protein TolC